MLQSLQSRPWKVVDLAVDWVKQTNELGQLQRRRQLSAVLECEVDAWSTILFATYFTNAAVEVQNFDAQVADSTGIVHTMHFYGTWQRENIRTRFDGGMALISQTVWQYYGTWEDVPEATP